LSPDAITSLRDQYQANIAVYRPEQLIFVDESTANEHIDNWKYTWTPNGSHLCQSKSKINKPSERWSIFPAYTIDGFITEKIFRPHSFSVDLFEFQKFIEFNVLPRCNSYPGPRSVIIMDNAPIHISEV
jgi:hypothetical protein